MMETPASPFEDRGENPRWTRHDDDQIRSPMSCMLFLSSCAGDRTASERIADMPHWMGGLPADAPPRRGTPEYDEMMAKRAQEAARPKTEQQQPK
jgi:hypothetical protein